MPVWRCAPPSDRDDRGRRAVCHQFSALGDLVQSCQTVRGLGETAEMDFPGQTGHRYTDNGYDRSRDLICGNPV